jgi:hypothetical protein
MNSEERELDRLCGTDRLFPYCDRQAADYSRDSSVSEENELDRLCGTDRLFPYCDRQAADCSRDSSVSEENELDRLCGTDRLFPYCDRQAADYSRDSSVSEENELDRLCGTDRLFPYCTVSLDMLADSHDAQCNLLDPCTECKPFDLLSPINSKMYRPEKIGAGFIGRPALYSVPGVVEYIENVLYHTSAAQNRRRTSEKTTIGISLSDLNAQLHSLFPLVRFYFPNLNNCTIRRLGESVHKGRVSDSSYHGVIPMRRISLQNNHFEFTDCAHDSFAQVSLICEAVFLAHGLGDRVMVIAMDDSAEEHLGKGCTFVSRYHQLQTMSSTQHQPSCPDHDFYEDKLTPSGYLILTPKLKDSAPTSYSVPFPAGQYNTYLDDKKRVRVVVPNDGPLHMFYTSPKLFSITVETHLSHISSILPNDVAFLSLMCDKGGDNTFEYDVNAVMYGRYWRDKKLEGMSRFIIQACISLLGLVVFSYKISAFNKVEHKFSPWKKKFSGLSFPLENKNGMTLFLLHVTHSKENRRLMIRSFWNVTAILLIKLLESVCFIISNSFICFSL